MVAPLNRKQTEGEEQFMTKMDSRMMTNMATTRMIMIMMMTRTCTTEDNGNSEDTTDNQRKTRTVDKKIPS